MLGSNFSSLACHSRLFDHPHSALVVVASCYPLHLLSQTAPYLLSWANPSLQVCCSPQQCSLRKASLSTSLPQMRWFSTSNVIKSRVCSSSLGQQLCVQCAALKKHQTLTLSDSSWEVCAIARSPLASWTSSSCFECSWKHFLPHLHPFIQRLLLAESMRWRGISPSGFPSILSAGPGLCFLTFAIWGVPWGDWCTAASLMTGGKTDVSVSDKQSLNVGYLLGESVIAYIKQDQVLGKLKEYGVFKAAPDHSRLVHLAMQEEYG